MGGTVGKHVRARARIMTIFKWEHGCVSSPTFRRTGAGGEGEVAGGALCQAIAKEQRGGRGGEDMCQSVVPGLQAFDLA